MFISCAAGNIHSRSQAAHAYKQIEFLNKFSLSPAFICLIVSNSDSDQVFTDLIKFSIFFLVFYVHDPNLEVVQTLSNEFSGSSRFADLKLHNLSFNGTKGYPNLMVRSCEILIFPQKFSST